MDVGGNFTLAACGPLAPGFDPGSGADSNVYAVAVSPDRKLVIGGAFTNVNGTARNRVARLNSDGTLDVSFDPGEGPNSNITAVAVQADGKIIIAGAFTSVGGTARNRIARLNANGALDATFDPGTGANSTILAMALHTNGLIAIGGEFTNFNGTARARIAQLNTNGTLYATFNPGVGANSNVLAVAMQSDGKVLIGGAFTSVGGTARNRIARLNVDGSHDTGFNPGTGANSNVMALAVLSDGRIAAGGNFTNFNGATRGCVVQLLANGNLDTTFNPGIGADRAVYALATHADRKLVIAGAFTNVGGVSCGRIARLHPGGAMDPSFDPGAGADGDIYALTALTNGAIAVGGDFVNFAGAAVGRVALLGAGGLVDLEGRGHLAGYGPGKNGPSPTATGWRGAGHGGMGTTYVGLEGLRTYGSITAPTNLGTGGGSCQVAPGVQRSGYGGGALVLNVAGTATINGRINANGTEVNIGAGSGGSVYIRANAMLGKGEISADSGPARNYAAGGGGRIALVTDGADFGSINCHAYGRKAVGFYGLSAGAAGTVYLEKSGDAPGKGTLIVDNNDENTSVYVTTMQNWSEESSYAFSTIILTNGGHYALETNNTLDITGTTLLGDPTDELDGIETDGGPIITPPALLYSNLFIRLKATNVVFSPSASLTVGDKAQLIADKPNTLNCAVTVNSGGKITHTPHLSVNAYPAQFDIYKVDLTINGNLDVKSGGAINVDNNGYFANEGPGKATGSAANRYAGAGYGGEGAEGIDGATYPGGTTYGAIRAPTDLGSGAGAAGSGGGAVIMRISGSAAINGSVSANGYGAGGNGNGSGGSVFITANSFSGSGSISANGGANTYANTGQGGGGRIALVTAGADFGSIGVQAYGGGAANTHRGAAGTIYLETAADGAGNGSLIVDALNNSGQAVSANTLLGTGVTEKAVGTVHIRNAGRLKIADGEELAVSRSWTNRAVFIAGTNSTVIFGSGSAAGIAGTNRFWNLSITNAGKELAFEAGATNEVVGLLNLRGAAGSLVSLASSSPGAFWYLTLLPGADQYVAYVSVQDSNASYGSTIGAADSHDGGHNLNWAFGGATITWDGSENTDWATAANWDLNRLPTVLDDVVIPDTPNDPCLDANRAVGSLTIQTLGALNMNGCNLTVNGLVDVNGNLAASGSEVLSAGGDLDFTGGSFAAASSTIRLAGSAAQTVTSAGAVYATLEVANTGGEVSFADGFAVLDAFICGTAGASMVFRAGAAYDVTRLSLSGQAADKITMRSSAPGTRWLLNVTDWNYVANVDVRDSDASGGSAINAIASTDAGNNLNWFFNTWSTWTGAVSSNFMDAANWSSGHAPGADSDLLIDGGEPVLNDALAIRRLAIGPTAWSRLSVNTNLAVSEYVDVMAYGIITHSSNVNVEAYKVILDVGKDLRVHAGGQINVDGRGYATPHGPGGVTNGTPNGFRTGASHGGRGGPNYYAQIPGPCYGSITNPVNLGSSSGMSTSKGSAGGGAVIITVSNKCIVNGIISADGCEGPSLLVNGFGEGGAAGGSINIRSGAVEGNGIIRANGGAGTPTKTLGGGGGGRVAIALNSGTDFGALDIGAHATWGAGDQLAAAGTVYLKKAGETYGMLIVDNNNIKGSDAYAKARTDISALVTNAVAGDVIMRYYGELRLMTNQSLVIGGDLKAESGGGFLAETNTLVVFEGADDSVIYGSNTFHNLTVSGSPKRLAVQANTLQTIYGKMSLTDVILRSTATGTRWRLNLKQACGPNDVRYVDVRDSDASPGNTVRASGSWNSGNNLNWVFEDLTGFQIRIW